MSDACRRCRDCGTHWPDDRDFYACPRCSTETHEATAKPDHAIHVARQLKQRYLDFVTYYVEHVQKPEVIERERQLDALEAAWNA